MSVLSTFQYAKLIPMSLEFNIFGQRAACKHHPVYEEAHWAELVMFFMQDHMTIPKNTIIVIGYLGKGRNAVFYEDERGQYVITIDPRRPGHAEDNPQPLAYWIQCLLHELAHLKQADEGRFVVLAKEGDAIFKATLDGVAYEYDDDDYDAYRQAPWEIEARDFSSTYLRAFFRFVDTIA